MFCVLGFENQSDEEWTVIMNTFISKEVLDQYPFIVDSSSTKNRTLDTSSFLDVSIKLNPIRETQSDSPEYVDPINTTYTLFCDTCGKCFSSKKSYLSHVYQSHPDKSTLNKYHCPHCSKKFHYQFLLNKHVKVSHSQYSFKCRECDNPYQSSKALKLHQRKKHS